MTAELLITDVYELIDPTRVPSKACLSLGFPRVDLSPLEGNLIMPRPLRVAIVGAGPAGIYAADVLLKSERPPTGCRIDLFERLPAPFGLIRYGVAPDHPRIKGIITALHQVLDKPQVRLFGNVDYGVDIKLDDLQRLLRRGDLRHRRRRPTATSTSPASTCHGSLRRRRLRLLVRRPPRRAARLAAGGRDGRRHRRRQRRARRRAHAGQDRPTSCCPPRSRRTSTTGLKANPATEVHVFARRGPAQAKFTPLELRELDHSPNVEVIVDPEDIDYDEGSDRDPRATTKQADMVAETLEHWAIRDVGDRPHKLFLHFFESPVEVLGEDGKVVGLRTERTELDGTGNVRGTGEFNDWEVQAVYRAVGYRQTSCPSCPGTTDAARVPNDGGRVLDIDGDTRCPASTSPAGSSAARSA